MQRLQPGPLTWGIETFDQHPPFVFEKLTRFATSAFLFPDGIPSLTVRPASATTDRTYGHPFLQSR